MFVLLFVLLCLFVEGVNAHSTLEITPGFAFPRGKKPTEADRQLYRHLRLIYFIPSDTQPLPKISDVGDQILPAQQRAFSKWNKANIEVGASFRVEKDFHIINGKRSAEHYIANPIYNIFSEIGEHFPFEVPITYVVIFNHERIKEKGVGGFAVTGQPEGRGYVVVSNEAGFWTVAHEIGHALGLQHDFRDPDNIMSYTHFKANKETHLSMEASQFFLTHPYFRKSYEYGQVFESMEFDIKSSNYFLVGHNEKEIEIDVGSVSGLHQILMHSVTTDGHPLANGDLELIQGKSLGGVRYTTVKMVYNGINPSAKEINKFDQVRNIDLKFSLISRSLIVQKQYLTIYPTSDPELAGVEITLIGDFNRDDRVDFTDFLLFAQAFGTSDRKFDLDRDGNVSFSDFIIFAANFNKGS